MMNNYSIIEQLLAEKLKAKGFKVFREYRLPGSRNRMIDLYIPFIPPAIIELKIISPDSNIKQKQFDFLNNFISQMYGEFRGSVIVFIVSNGKFDINVNESFRKDVHYLSFKNESDLYDSEFENVASEIVSVLRKIRNQRAHGIVNKGILNKSSSLASMNDELVKNYSKSWNDVNNIQALWKKNQAAEKNQTDNYLIKENKTNYGYLNNQATDNLNNKNQSDKSPKKDYPKIQIESILKIFLELVDENTFQIINHEIKQLILEYESGHFTACALRVGRCLEFIVYSLAKSWKVPVDTITIKFIDDLQNRIQEINSKIIDFKDSEDAERKNVKKSIIKKASELSARIIEITAFLDDINQDYSTGTRTQNIQSILTDIKNKYIMLKVVREDILKIKKTIQIILELRNNAAHASAEGGSREINKQQVEQMINNIELILFNFSLIGRVITDDLE